MLVKKTLSVLLFLVFVCSQLYAAEEISQKLYDLGDSLYCLKISIKASADGSVTDTLTEKNIDGWLLWVQVDPGTTVPTAAYDITLIDERGEDVMGGMLGDLSATVTRSTKPYDVVANEYDFKITKGKLTLNLDNNSTDGALVDIYIYYRSSNYHF